MPKYDPKAKVEAARAALSVLGPVGNLVLRHSAVLLMTLYEVEGLRWTEFEQALWEHGIRLPFGRRMRTGGRREWLVAFCAAAVNFTGAGLGTLPHHDKAIASRAKREFERWAREAERLSYDHSDAKYGRVR